MITKKRAIWLLLVIDRYLSIDFNKFKLLLNEDDKEFLKAAKEFNKKIFNELNICYELKSIHKHIILPFLEKNTIDDGFNIVFTDSPNFDINVYNDCFVHLPNGNKKSKLTLYSIQLILGK